MVGRTFYNMIASLLMLLILLLPATISGDQGQGWLAVLLSDSEESYEAPVNAFIDNVPLEVRIFNLHGDIRNDPSLRARLFEDNPGMIFSLGAKATFVAKMWTQKRQDILVLFAMVINWKQYGLLDGQKNIVGISSEVNPGNQFLDCNGRLVPIAELGGHYVRTLYW